MKYICTILYLTAVLASVSAYDVRCDLQWNKTASVYISTSYQALDENGRHDIRLPWFSDDGTVFEEAIVCDPALYFYNQSLTNITFLNHDAASDYDVTNIPHDVTLLNITCLNRNPHPFRAKILPPSSYPRLQSLGIRCGISNPTPGYFTDLYYLVLLDLSNNNITHLDRVIFRDVRGLTILMLNHNPIVSYDPEWLCGYKRLYSLDIQGSLGHFPLEMFTNTSLGCKKLGYTQILRLSRNSFNYIPPFALSGFGDLSNELQISGSDVSDIHPDAFVGLNTVNYVFLTDNQLTNLSADVFRPMNSLLDVDLSRNHLTKLPDGIFADNGRLEGIRLSGNNFALWEGIEPATDSIEVLDLSGNKITNITAHNFKTTPYIGVIYLQHNSITAISGRAFQGLNNLYKLNLSSNAITDLLNEPFRDLPYLKYLDLSGNKIAHLPPLLLAHNHILEELRLNNNQMKSLDVEALILSRGSVLSLASFHGNPLVCDCSLEPLKQWISNYTFKVENYAEILCWMPGEESMTSSLLKTPDLCPQLSTDQRHMTAVISVLVIIVISLCTCLLLFYYRHEAAVILYAKYNIRCRCTHPETGEGDKLYDAFVSHSSKDEYFVIKSLLPTLEHKFGFKLCLHQRDFPVGETIAGNILKAVDASKKTILIVSRHFLTSEWCKYEFQIAHHQLLTEGGRRVVMVLMEDIKAQEMTGQLRSYVKTHTYLRRDDKLFWEKLLYALPRIHVHAPLVNTKTEHTKL